MILSRNTIKRSIFNEEIAVEPEPIDDQFQPASLDLRIGGELYDIDDNRFYEFDEYNPVTLRPNRPYLGHTIDNISLPNDVLAQVAGRSTVARRGVIVHMTAGIVDPGWEGQLTLEMYNFTNSRKKFKIGDRVAQLVFHRVDEKTQGYDGSYQRQEGVTLPVQ